MKSGGKVDKDSENPAVRIAESLEGLNETMKEISEYLYKLANPTIEESYVKNAEYYR